MGRPYRSRLIVAHGMETPSSCKEKRKSMFRNCMIMKPRAISYDNVATKASVQHVVWSGSERLDPFETPQTSGSIFQVAGGVAPSNKDFSIDVFLWDGFANIV